MHPRFAAFAALARVQLTVASEEPEHLCSFTTAASSRRLAPNDASASTLVAAVGVHNINACVYAPW